MKTSEFLKEANERWADKMIKKLYPSDEIVRKVLTNTEEGHNKFYIIMIKKINIKVSSSKNFDKFQLSTFWGKINDSIEFYEKGNLDNLSSGQRQVKGNYGSISEAQMEANKLIDAKIKKGYVVI